MIKKKKKERKDNFFLMYVIIKIKWYFLKFFLLERGLDDMLEGDRLFLLNVCFEIGVVVYLSFLRKMLLVYICEIYFFKSII